MSNKINVNEKSLYCNNKNKERTKKRLSQLSSLKLEYVGEMEFGYPGVTSGLYIEKIWNCSDEEWQLYLIYLKDVLITSKVIKGLTSEHKPLFKKLQRQCAERYSKLYDKGTYGRIKNKKPNSFNNKLKEFKDFMNDIPYADFSNNFWMNLNPVE